jgi:telomerase reverse transcriptase
MNSGGGEELLENGTVKLESGASVFPWCGLLFNTSTGEVGIDYSRFANRKAIDGLTIDRSGKEGKLFEIRMKSFVRPRCQALLFDPQINGPEVIRINFHQMMLLSAIKTGEYLHKGLPGGVGKNSHFVVRCIEALVSYAHSLIITRLGTKCIERMAFLGKLECDFLSLDAFHHVFNTMMVSTCTDFNCTIVLGLLQQRILKSSLLKDHQLLELISRSRNQFHLATLTKT